MDEQQQSDVEALKSVYGQFCDLVGFSSVSPQERHNRALSLTELWVRLQEARSTVMAHSPTYLQGPASVPSNIEIVPSNIE